MTINLTNLKADIAKILGDYENQFTTEIDNELKSAVIWLTSHYIFSWNILETTNTAHTNGIVTLPTGCAKILQIADSDYNINYAYVPDEKFFLHKKLGASGRVEIYPSVGNSTQIDQTIPFILREDPSNGSQTLIFGTLSSTPASRTFNILYSKYHTDITGLLGLDRLYPYFLAKTVYNMLVKSENPDTALLSMYEKQYMTTLQIELDFGNNRALQKYNSPTQSPHLLLYNKFSGI